VSSKPEALLGFHIMRSGWTAAAALIVATLLCLAPPAAAPAQNATPAAPAVLSPGFAFTETNGEDLYANVCQACHMSDGKGATGAGTYPALAGDGALEAAGYPIHVVVKGRHGMPPVGMMMTDDQVAAVVNYVRTHFGNDYRDAVTAADVKAVRGTCGAEPCGADIMRRRP
jgi:mono/diheme cytochrome c family protein